MKTVLVVDDEKHILQTVTIALEMEGFRVLSATSVQEAMRHAAKEPFDLLLCDINMPDGDGFYLVDRLQNETGNFVDLPIIFMTGLPIREHQEKAEQAGARAVLKKPFKLREVTDLVNTELGLI